MDFGLTDKRAFVGGGSRGIGKAIAIELASEGCDVVIAARTESALGDGRRDPRYYRPPNNPHGPRCNLPRGSRQRHGQRSKSTGRTRYSGQQCILTWRFCSAVGPIHGLDEDDLLRDFDTKYVGALRCARAAIPYLKEQPGVAS